MKTFIEWTEEDPSLDEDWKKWARNAALGASLAGAGFGLGKMGTQTGTQTANPAQMQQQQQPVSKFDQAFRLHKQNAARLRAKAAELEKAGRTSGTFTHGELDDDNLEDDSATSDDAASYLN